MIWLDCSAWLQVTDIPLQDLPLEVKHVLEKYAAHLDVHVVSEFIMIILAAILETVPEGKSNQSVPKAKVSQRLQQLIWQGMHGVHDHFRNSVLKT